MPSPAILDSLDGAGRGTYDGNSRQGVRDDESTNPRVARFGKLRHGVFRRAAEHDVRDAHERRIGRRLASADFVGNESLVVVRHGALYGVVLRDSRLNQHLTAFRSAARATGNLAEQLKTPLRGAEIRKIDSD